MLPRTNTRDLGGGIGRQGQIVPYTSSPHITSEPSSMYNAPVANKSVIEQKAEAYAEVVRSLNIARERGLLFKVRN